jgi:hypothetical protein
MVCLWSADVLHALRLHTETFRPTFPDSAGRFETRWSGSSPPVARPARWVVLDPFAGGRQRRGIDLETALTRARPRYRDDAHAAARLRETS